MSKQIEFTMVKTEFPNGWKETPFELLLKRLDENGFSIKETKEVSADEMVMDARPHADIYVIEKDGRQFTFQIGLTRDLRHGDEHLDGIGWFKPRYSGKAAPVKFEIPQTWTWTENVPLSNTGLGTSPTTSTEDQQKNATSTTNTGNI